MITQEMKEIIEKDAKNYAAAEERVELSWQQQALYQSGVELGYIAAGTKYAEKVESLEKEIKQFERMHDNLLSINKSKEAELSRLKVIAEKMKDALNGSDRLNDNSKDVREALTAYAEFCKEK